MQEGYIYTDGFTGSPRIWVCGRGEILQSSIDISPFLKSWLLRRLTLVGYQNQLQESGEALSKI